TLPDIGTNSDIALLAGTQTFTGAKTFNDITIADTSIALTGGSPITITPSSDLTIGSTTKNLTLQGATTTLSDTAGGITNSLVFATPTGSNKTISIPDTSGTIALLEANQTFSGNNIFTGTADFQNATGITVGKDETTGTPNIPGQIQLISSGDNAYSTIFQTATQSANITYTLPPVDGSSNYVLTTNGSGLLSWQSSSGIGAGTITQVGNITTGAAFTGGDLGNNLTFQGSTSTVDGNNITITAVNPAASVTYTLPDIG